MLAGVHWLASMRSKHGPPERGLALPSSVGMASRTGTHKGTWHQKGCFHLASEHPHWCSSQCQQEVCHQSMLEGSDWWPGGHLSILNNSLWGTKSLL